MSQGLGRGINKVSNSLTLCKRFVACEMSVINLHYILFFPSARMWQVLTGLLGEWNSTGYCQNFDGQGKYGQKIFIIQHHVLHSFVTYIPHPLRNMWPIQLAFLLFIVCRIFPSFLSLCKTTVCLTYSVQLIFSILFQNHYSKSYR